MIASPSLAARLADAKALFTLCFAAALIQWPATEVRAQPVRAEPPRVHISSSQFRANPLLLDRHPMDVDSCRLVEHRNTGYCYVYSLGEARKVSEETDARCSELEELRKRMRSALDRGFCSDLAAAEQAQVRPGASETYPAQRPASDAPSARQPASETPSVQRPASQPPSAQPPVPEAAATQPQPPAIVNPSIETVLLFFLYRLSWVLPIFFLIGWLRWWPMVIFPVAYVFYVRWVSWLPVDSRSHPDQPFAIAFAAYGLLCLAAMGAGAFFGRRRHALTVARHRDAAVEDGAAESSVPKRKIKRSWSTVFSQSNTGWVDGLPFSTWAPLWAGAAAGLMLRLVFSGKPGHTYAAMMATFIYLSPLLVGAITVYVAETSQRRSWAYYLWAPFLANVLYIAGTLLIMIEGLICAIVIVPLFAFMGSIGGVIMGAVCRATRWPKPVIYGLGVLPLFLGAIETGMPLPERLNMVERTVTIESTPARVWQEIHNARDIRPEEVGSAWMYRIGVPMPKAGITRMTPAGRVRKITMGKDIHFDQVVTDWEDNRYVRWTYRFGEDSFPPYALDDHVVLGGHYFDVRDTSYTLTPHGKSTELKIRMQYRVSTQFNWYADPIAAFLFGNFEEVILDFYRRRSEAEPA
jgi:hypothetical protein